MKNVKESPDAFETRKADHIRLALDESCQSNSGAGLNKVNLIHEALPEIDFDDVQIEQELFSRPMASPFFISSMTAGHTGSLNINLIMARVAERRRWPMGVGSQRRQLTDFSVDSEWRAIRKECPRVRFFGNIGLSQLIRSEVSEIRRLADTLEAEAMIVHTNPLQECLQPEGTRHFAGGYRALENLVKELGLPVIVKETGCGFSSRTLARLSGIGLAAVDVAGRGGTHWGRIEGGRSAKNSLLFQAAETFGNWGIDTVDSLLTAKNIAIDFELWASGGVRSGLDAAKLLALGASRIGLAKPLIEAALKGEQALDREMERLEYELKVAMFCTGSRTIEDLGRSVETVDRNGGY